jgi:hypothetical protein
MFLGKLQTSIGNGLTDDEYSCRCLTQCIPVDVPKRIDIPIGIFGVFGFSVQGMVLRMRLVPFCECPVVRLDERFRTEAKCKGDVSGLHLRVVDKPSRRDTLDG